MGDISKGKVSVAIRAGQMAACVGVLVYISYCEGLLDGKASVDKSAGSDLPADDTADDSAPSPKSTSLDGE